MSGTDSIRVAIRVRPLIKREHDANALLYKWRVEGNTIQLTNNGKAVSNATYTFDQVFAQRYTTEEVYDEFAKPVVLSAMDGFNGTIFAYGQTSSGKTYTMMGSQQSPGVIPRTADEIFQYIEKWPTREFLLRVSYMEIYNEVISDLLNPGNKNLKIHENVKRQVYVGDLTEEMVTTKEQILAVMSLGESHRHFGESHRHFGETNMNERSSRSHTIFRMVIESRELQAAELEPDSIDGAVRVAHLNLVDLAGSERVATTGAEGLRLREGGHINKSLFTLGSVISKLSDGESFIPFRDSKLTRILQSSLGGNAKTSILCTVTPASIEETTSSLKFASRAKTIKNCPEVNEVLDDGTLLKRYRKEIRALKKQLEQTGKSLFTDSDVQELQSEKEKMAQMLEEKNKLQRDQEEKIKRLGNMICHSGRVQPEAAVPKGFKRRETWCPGRSMFKAPILPRAAEVAAVKNRLPRLSTNSSSSSANSSLSFEFNEMPRDLFLAELDEQEELAAREEPTLCDPFLARVNVVPVPVALESKQIQTGVDPRLKEMEQTNQQLRAALENAVKEKELLDDLLSKSNTNLQVVLMQQSRPDGDLVGADHKRVELEEDAIKDKCTLEEALARMTEERDAIREDLSEAISDSVEIQKDLVDAQQKMKQYKDFVKELESDLEVSNNSSSEKISSLEAQLHSSQQDLKEHEARVAQIEASLVSANESRSAKEQELNLLAANLGRQVTETQEELTKSQNRVTELETSLISANESRSAKEQEFNLLVANLGKQVTETQEELTKSQNRVTELETSLVCANEKQSQKEQELDSLVTILETQVAEAREEMATSKERVSELESGLVNQSDKEQELNLLVAKLQEEVDEFRKETKTSEGQVAELEDALVNQSDKEQELNLLVAKLQEQTKTSEGRVAELEAVLVNQSDKEQELNLLVAKLEEDVDEVRKETKTSEGRVAELEAALVNQSDKEQELNLLVAKLQEQVDKVRRVPESEAGLVNQSDKEQELNLLVAKLQEELDEVRRVPELEAGLVNQSHKEQELNLLVAKLREEVDEVREETKASEGRAAELEAALVNQSDKEQELNLLVAKLQEQVDEVRKETKTSQVSELEAGLVNQSDKEQELDLLVAKLQEEVDEVRKETKTSGGRAAEVEAGVVAAKADQSDKEQELNLLVVKLQEEVDEVRKETETSEGRVAELEAALVNQSDKEQELNLLVAKLQEEVDEVRKETETSEGRVAELEAALFAAKADQTGNGQETTLLVAKLEAEVVCSREELRTAEELVAELEALIEANEKQVSKEQQLSLQIENLTTEIAEVRERLNGSEERVAELEASTANSIEIQSHGIDEEEREWDGSENAMSQESNSDAANLEVQIVDAREMKQPEMRFAESEAFLGEGKEVFEDGEAQQRLLDHPVQLSEMRLLHKRSVKERVAELESRQASVSDAGKEGETIVVANQGTEGRVTELESRTKDEVNNENKSDGQDREQCLNVLVENLERQLSETREELQKSELKVVELESNLMAANETRQFEEDLDVLIVDLETKLAEAQEQLDHSESKVAELTSSLAEEKERRCADHKKQEEELLCSRAEYEIISGKLCEERTDHTKVCDEYDQLKLTTKELRGAKEELEDKMKRQEEALEAAEERLQVVQKELEQYRENALTTTALHDNMPATLQLDELKRLKEEISRELTEEQRAHQGLRKEFDCLQGGLQQAKKSLLRDSNRDMDQQRTIDLMVKERRESIFQQAQIRQEVEKGRSDAEKKVSEVAIQCKQVSGEKDLLEHRLEVANREVTKTKQDMRDMENLYSSHNSWAVPSSNTQGDKVAQKLKQLQFNLELTKQKCEKAEKRAKELENENRHLAGADCRNGRLIEERDAAQHQMKEAKERLGETTRRLSDLGVQVTQLRAHVDQLTNENKKLKAQLDSKENKVEDLEQKLWVEQEKTKLGSNRLLDNEKLQKEVNAANARNKEQIDELNATLARLRQERDELQAAKTAIEGTLAETEEEVKRFRELDEERFYLQDENLTLYEDMKGMEELHVKDNALIKELQAELVAEKQEKEPLGNQLSELTEAPQKEVTESEDQRLIEELREELLAVTWQQAALENESKKLSEVSMQENLKLQEENRLLGEVYRELQGSISRDEARFEDQQVEQSSSKQDIAALENKLTETKKKEGAVLDELKMLRDSALKDKDVIEELHEELSLAREQKDAFEIEMKQLSAEGKFMIQQAQESQEEACKNMARSEEEVADVNSRLREANDKNHELERRLHESCQSTLMQTEHSQKEIADLRRQLQDISNEKQTLEELFEMGRKNEQGLDEKREILESAVTDLKAELGKVKQQAVEGQDLFEKEEFIRILQDQLCDLQAKISEGERLSSIEMKELSTVIRAKQDELDARTTKILYLEAELCRMTSDGQQQAVSAHTDLATENSELKAQHEEDLKKMSRIENESDNLYEDSNKLKGIIDEQQDELDARTTKILCLEAELCRFTSDGQQQAVSAHTDLATENSELKAQHEDDLKKMGRMENESDSLYEDSNRLKGIIDEQQDELDEYTTKIKKLESELCRMTSDGQQQAVSAHTDLATENSELKAQHEDDLKKMGRMENESDKLHEERRVDSDRLKGIIDEQQDELDARTTKILHLESELCRMTSDGQQQAVSAHTDLATENSELKAQHEEDLKKMSRIENESDNLYEDSNKLKGIIDEQQGELEESAKTIKNLKARMSQEKTEDAHLKQVFTSKELEETRLQMADKNMEIQGLQREVFNLKAALEETARKAERMLAHEQRKIASLKEELRSQRQEQTMLQSKGSSNALQNADVGVVSTVAIYSLRANLGRLEESNNKLSKRLEQLQRDHQTLSMLKTEESNKVAKLSGENHVLRKELSKFYDERKKTRRERQVDPVLAPSNLPGKKQHPEESHSAHASDENTADITTPIERPKTAVSQKPSKPEAPDARPTSNWLNSDAADYMFKEDANQCKSQ